MRGGVASGDANLASICPWAMAICTHPFILMFLYLSACEGKVVREKLGGWGLRVFGFWLGEDLVGSAMLRSDFLPAGN